MKVSLYICALTFALFATHLSAQNVGAISENDWTKNWTDYKPQRTASLDHTVVLPSVIDKDYTLSNQEIYLVKDVVYVTNNATLTIESGTHILGDVDTKGTLLIDKTSSITAKGVISSPIVFTSSHASGQRKAGDWGGIVILGQDSNLNTLSGTGALTEFSPAYNSYGGSSTGGVNKSILSFVRIEYAGGRKTGALCTYATSDLTLKNVQLTYSATAGLFSVGGVNNAENIIALNNLEDDFHYSNGGTFSLKNAIAIKSKLHSGHSKIRAAVEISDYLNETFYAPNKKHTEVTLDYVTFFTSNQGIPTPNSFEGIYLSQNASCIVRNSLIQNFRNGIDLENPTQYKKKLTVENVVMNSIEDPFGIIDETLFDEIHTYYNEGNKITSGAYTNYLVDDNGRKKFDFTYQSTDSIENVSGN